MVSLSEITADGLLSDFSPCTFPVGVLPPSGGTPQQPETFVWTLGNAVYLLRFASPVAETAVFLGSSTPWRRTEEKRKQ